MAYSDFTLERALKDFSLTLVENVALFPNAGEVPVSDFLRAILVENTPLALAIHTEKARSEMIVAPILIELRRMQDHRISLFSGIDFSVDKDRGLAGYCDYILSRSAEQLMLKAPIVTVVEAKNDNVKSGYGQCAAGMVAAQIFNQKNEQNEPVIYGVVTTGSIWKFLRLEGTTLWIDSQEFYLDNLERIQWILLSIVA